MNNWFVHHAVVSILYWIFSLVNYITKRIRNYHNLKDSFETSATLETVCIRSKDNLFTNVSGNDFLTYNSKVIHPNYVLQDTVSLYALDHKQAYFVECSPDVNIYSSDVFPFFYVAQFQNAKRVVCMPLASFRQLADQVGPPTVKTILVWNTGRCGSTLLTQIFESIGGNTICMGEPDVFDNLINMRGHGQINTDQYKALLKSTFSLLLKPWSRPIDLVCMKFQCEATQNMLSTYEVLPQENIKHIFMYRDVIPTSQSYETVTWSVFPSLYWWFYARRTPVLRSLVKHQRIAVKYYIAPFIFPETEAYSWIMDDELLLPLSELVLWAMKWGLLCAMYQDALHAGMPVVGLHYDDIVKNSRTVCECLNDKLDMGVDNIWEKVEAAFHRDSQRGSTYSQTGVKRRAPSVRDLANIESLLRRFGVDVPVMGRSELANTLMNS